MNEPTIKIMLVDDHFVVRMGLAAILECEPGFRVVASIGSGKEAIGAYEQYRPDITLLDIRIPDLDGIAVLRGIRQYSLKAKVLMLSTFDTEDDIYQSVSAGADGFLSKTASQPELIKSIREILAGRKVFPKQILERLEHRRELKLTQRHYDMLRCLEAGLSNDEIAVKLAISKDTVKTHLKNLYILLEAGNRAEAVQIAIKRGFIKITT